VTLAEVLLWGAVALVGFVFVGYPLVLTLFGRPFERPVAADDGHTPPVTLIISAYNEAAVIAEKLDNSLALDYPGDRLEIVVVSDASDDATDAIVANYADRGVRLFRMGERRGKTVGLNAAVPGVAGEIVVFSDANAMYQPDAVRKLARNFADPRVGCVTGDSRYVGADQTQVGPSEDRYWNYERRLKVRESAVGSMVGADGAIFAIRKALYMPLKAEDINDFVLPLRIVAAGHRCVFEPEAVCLERTTVTFGEEFRRKVRVVNRSWNGLFRYPAVLNPFRHGWFAVQVIVHKLLRWLTPLFLLVILACSAVLAGSGPVYALLAGLQGVLYAAAVVGLLLERAGVGSGIFAFPSYFLLMNVSSALGVGKALRGERITIWQPEREEGDGRRRRAALSPGLALLMAAYAGAALVTWRAPAVAFWLALGAIGYTYAGYPLLLAALLRRPATAWPDPERWPSLTLLVVAYNEAEVIRAKLEDCLALHYPGPLTIVAASDGSGDGTDAVMLEFAARGVTVRAYPERAGKAAVINRLMRDVETDVVVFTDANVFLEPDALTALARPFADPRVGAVTGYVTLVNPPAVLQTSEPLYYGYEHRVRGLESRSGKLVGVDGALYGVRREAFVAPSDRVVVDDLAVALAVARTGWRVVYEPRARATESSVASLGVEFRRRARIVAGSIQCIIAGECVPGPRQPVLLFNYLSHKVLRWHTPVFLLMLLAASAGLAGDPAYRFALAAQAAFCGAGLVGLAVGVGAPLLAVPLYVLTLSAAALVGLARGLRNRQPAYWDRLDRAGTAP